MKWCIHRKVECIFGLTKANDKYAQDSSSVEQAYSRGKLGVEWWDELELRVIYIPWGNKDRGPRTNSPSGLTGLNVWLKPLLHAPSRWKIIDCALASLPKK